MLTVRGKHYASDVVCDFHIADGRIEAIREPGAAPADVGGKDCWVAPGLIDIQVNGFGGYDSGVGDDSGEAVTALAQELLAAGVTAFCPTVTTRSGKETEAALRSIAAACDQDSVTQDRVIGIHLEGPYISREDGPRGAHPLEHVRDPDWQEFQHWQELSGGRIRMITLAPELPHALEFIERCAKADIVVAIGHLAADREQIEAAVAAGAVLSTHLGNGAHAQLPRHDNYIWEQMANDALSASIIADGHHLPPAVIKSIFRVKGVKRLILVSDAVWAAGLAPGAYTLMGASIHVRADGSVRLGDTPYLAGSTLRLCDAIGNFMRMANASFRDAISMATENPARLLGVARERGHLRAMARADITVFRPTQAGPELLATVIGDLVWPAQESRSYYPAMQPDCD
jgi:N-acetylglucosamine-6-phosphate deacetylase